MSHKYVKSFYKKKQAKCLPCKILRCKKKEIKKKNQSTQANKSKIVILNNTIY